MIKTTILTDVNSINIMLFTDLYYNSHMLYPYLSFLFAQQRSACCLINKYDDDDDDDDDEVPKSRRGVLPLFKLTFSFYQVVRPSGRKSVNKYLYMYLYHYNNLHKITAINTIHSCIT